MRIFKNKRSFKSSVKKKQKKNCYENAQRENFLSIKCDVIIFIQYNFCSLLIFRGLFRIPLIAVRHERKIGYIQNW